MHFLRFDRFETMDLGARSLVYSIDWSSGMLFIFKVLIFLFKSKELDPGFISISTGIVNFWAFKISS